MGPISIYVAKDSFLFCDQYSVLATSEVKFILNNVSVSNHEDQAVRMSVQGHSIRDDVLPSFFAFVLDNLSDKTGAAMTEPDRLTLVEHNNSVGHRIDEIEAGKYSNY